MDETERRLNHFLVQVFHDLLRAEERCLSTGSLCDLSLKELHVIEVASLCAQEGDSRATRVAQRLGVTPGTLTTAVTLLEQKGYLLRTRDQRDRRVKRVELTEKGRSANEIHRQFHQEMVRQVLRELSAEEARVFIRGLESVSRFFAHKKTKRGSSQMRIITDSTSDLTPELCAQLGVDLVIPMRITIDGQEFLDKVDITDERFYHELLPGCKELPKTSQTTVNEFLEAFARFPDEELLVLPLSSGLSGSYSSACVAREMSGRENIHVVDCKSTALALALMARVACQRRDEGKTAAEIQRELESLSGRVRVYAPVETLHYLVMGGRLSRVAGFVGTALNLKPIICLKDGALTAVGKARGAKAAARLVRELVDAHEEIDLEYPVHFGSAFNPEGVRMLREAFPEVPADAPELTVGCIVGTHTGPGVFAIAFIAKA